MSATASEHGAAKRRVAVRAARMGINPGAGSIPSDSTPGTVSAATVEAYLARGRQLHLRYLRETGTEDGCGQDFAGWLLGVRDTVCPSTWRQYRAGGLHWLGGYEDAAEAMSMLNAPRSPAAGKTDRRTSGLKAKRLPLADLHAITAYLHRQSRSTFRHALIDWLWAGILVGLRPSEWRCAELADVDGVPHLYVRSAKSTNGRSTGAVRTLDLGMLTADQVETVRRMAHNGSQWAAQGTFGDWLEACGHLLYDACNVLWRGKARAARHYTLYSARHQFVSNLKEMVGDPVQLAALCGHAVTDTAASHYGRRRSAWPLDAIPAPPRAIAEEMARVVDNRRSWRPMAPVLSQ